MKNWIYIIYIGLMGFLASSCQSSLEEEVQLPPGKVKITFTLALDDLNSRSRAEGDWNENETTGVIGDNYENQIDLSTQNGLQVLVYSADGNTFLGEVTNKEVIRKADENGRAYEFQGDLEVNAEHIENGTLTCRLMVFANCTTKVSSFLLGTLSYAYNPEYIPMWGVQQCTLTLEKGEMSRVTDPIYLLRAMAKVEVKLADEIKSEYNLTSVTLDKYNPSGYVLPKGYESATDTKDLMQQDVFRPFPGTGEGSLTFKGEDGVFHIYIPEYQNVGDNASLAAMTVTIDGKDYPLHFKDYENDTPFNVVRNHYYQYTITGIDEEVEVTSGNLVYDVVVSTSQEIIVPPFE